MNKDVKNGLKCLIYGWGIVLGLAILTYLIYLFNIVSILLGILAFSAILFLSGYSGSSPSNHYPQ